MARVSNPFKVWLQSVLGAVAFTVCLPALADVKLTLERLSDTQVILSGSGEMGAVLPPENVHSLYLQDPFTNAPAALSVHSILEDSELHTGDFYFNFANAAGSGIGGAFNNTIYMGRDIGVLPFPTMPSGEPFGGTMFLELNPGESFAPVGATGVVYWGTTNGNVSGVLSGSWEMVAPTLVPESSSIVLMAAGLGLLLAFRGRRRG